ncbi:MAG: PmoA family protein [Cyclobacteriaceae bacterium]
MKLPILKYFLFAIAFCFSCNQKPAPQVETTSETPGPEITFEEHEAEKRIDVMIDGKLFTAYQWPDNVFKPILYPIISAGGTEVTRGFPLQPREGERNDHRHQVGNWLNYGNVNGYDFWGNGSEGKRSQNGGEIKHLSVEKLSGGKGEATLVALASWKDPSDKEVLTERTEYHFITSGTVRIVDRITTLTNPGTEVVNFKDTKEGMFGIRVARQLELPSNEELTLTDAQGNPTTVKKMSNEGVTGNYRSSEGITGEKVWSTRAKWMNLYGSIGNEKISLVICDHPENISYPTYWHARGYGLFSANPLGAKDFTQGKEEINYSLPAGQSLTFRYRIVVSSGSHLTDDQINSYTEDFAKKY